MARRIPTAAVLLVAAIVLPAAGQESPFDPWERVDPGVGDADALSTSLRDPSADLRIPSDFDHVYRLPGPDPWLMRVDGGLHVVFPRSEYWYGRQGTMPLIPAGAVFSIGEPDMTMLGLGLPGRDVPAPAPESREPEGSTAIPVPLATMAGSIGGLRLEAERTGGADATDAPPRMHRTPRIPDGWSSTSTPATMAARTIVTDARYRTVRIRELMQRAVERASGDQRR